LPLAGGSCCAKWCGISKEQNITSLADFLSSRYDRSAILGAIVTLFAVFGITPYIALQLKAIAQTLDILFLPLKNLDQNQPRFSVICRGKSTQPFSSLCCWDFSASSSAPATLTPRNAMKDWLSPWPSNPWSSWWPFRRWYLCHLRSV
jgi:hypothetical protein